MKELSNARVKLIRSLSQKKFRDETGLFIVEGEKMVGEALESGFEVEEVWREEEIGTSAMSRISSLSSPSPSLAVVRQPRPDDKPMIGRAGLYLALDSIRDPGNMGTILRSADWFGFDGVVASRDSVDVYNPKVVQATMGAIFRIRFAYDDIPSVCRRAKEAGGQAYGTFLDGEDIYSAPTATGEDFPVVLVVGNESRGISADVSAEVTGRLCIPCWRGNGSESLNAAVAATVVMAEFRRRARA